MTSSAAGGKSVAHHEPTMGKRFGVYEGDTRGGFRVTREGVLDNQAASVE
jgi:hypothetical protein